LQSTKPPESHHRTLATLVWASTCCMMPSCSGIDPSKQGVFVCADSSEILLAEEWPPIPGVARQDLIRSTCVPAGSAGTPLVFGILVVSGAHQARYVLRVSAVIDIVEQADSQHLLDVALTPIDSQAMKATKLRVSVTNHLRNGMCPAPQPPNPANVLGLSEEGKAAIAIMDIVRIVEKSPKLSDLFWSVARSPSFLSLVAGARLSAAVGIEKKRTCDHAVLGQPAVSFPVQLMINGFPALNCDIIATKPVGLLAICGGLVAMQATRVDDPSHFIIVKLLGCDITP